MPMALGITADKRNEIMPDDAMRQLLSQSNTLSPPYTFSRTLRLICLVLFIVALHLGNSNAQDVFSAAVGDDPSLIKISLDFIATGLHVDDDEKFAVVWGPKIVKDRSGNLVAPLAKSADKILVVNLETHQLVANRQLNYGVHTAIIQGPYVTVMPNVGGTLFRLERDTLADGKRRFLNAKGTRLVSIGKSLIHVRTERQQMWMDLETFRPTTIDFRSNRNITFASRIAPGFVAMDNKVLSIQDGAIAMLTLNPGMTLLPPAGSDWNKSKEFEGHAPKGTKIFGRTFYGRKILNGSKPAVADFPRGQVFPTPHYPIAHVVTTEVSRPDNSLPKLNTTISMVRLIDGSELSSRLIDSSVRDPITHSSNYMLSRSFAPLTNKLVYARSDEFFIIPFGKSKVDSVTPPLHFPVFKIPILGVANPAKISFEAKGGQGKIKYKLATPYAGVEVDANSGEVSIDTPSLWETFLDNCPTPRHLMSQFESDTEHSPNRLMLDADYKTLVAAPLAENKKAVLVPIHLSATCEDQQEDEILVFAIVHGPKVEYDQAVVKNQAAWELKQDQTRKDAAKRQQESMQSNRLAAETKRREIGNSPVPRELQNRVRRLELLLEAVMQQLDELDNSDNRN